EDVQPLAVAGRRTGSVAVLRDVGAAVVGLRLDGGHLLVPLHLPAAAVQAEDVPLEVRRVARAPCVEAVTRVRGEEDSVADDDGTGRSGARQFGPPDDVRPGAPRDGQVLVLGNAQAVRATELRPVGGAGAQGEGEGKGGGEQGA